MVTGIVFTVFVGVTFQLLDDAAIIGGAAAFWEAVKESKELFPTLTPIITPAQDPNNLLPFPLPQEGEIRIDTFEKVNDILNADGNENITWIPLDPIDDLSENVESFPQRDEILESLFNGPFIFPSDGDVPLGNYVLASNRDGDFIGYNSNSLSNLENNSWNSILEQGGELTVFNGKEIPIRESLPDRFINGKKVSPRTHGVFETSDSSADIKFVSGNSDISIRVRQKIVVPPDKTFNRFAGEAQSLTPVEIKLRVNKSLSHVEGHAASTIRELNLESGRVVINNESGPCANCAIGVPRILPDGATLEVIYTDVLGRFVTDTFTGGKRFDVNTDRKIEEIDF